VTLAKYDYTLKVPKCATTSQSCSSGTLLDGRSSLGPAEEGKSPNTILTCTDGTVGSYHSDESIDAIKVSSTDGGLLTAGKTAEIEARVFVYDQNADFADFYYATNPSNPTWTLISTVSPLGNGVQTMKAQYTLPVGKFQAVRVVFRYTGSASTSSSFQCPSGSYDDVDDI
jgi:leucyl aminopeptidase